MLAFRSGDLVVLKSGGPVMTIDTVNTSIFDDAEITGVLCVWFVEDKLQRVRFDHRAIQPLVPQAPAPQASAASDVPDNYSAVMDSMVGAMNPPGEPALPAKPKRRPKKTAATAHHGALS